MEAQARDELNADDRRCPQCGSEETGYFCRNCGGLLHGDDDLVLCPRCRQVVPEGEFCNQCGQSLGGLALSLRQLALAGDAFWVTGEAAPPGSPEPSLLALDGSVELAPAELPDWLQELPAESAPPEVQQHIYPALRPIQTERAPGQQRRFLIVAILLMGLLLLSVVLMALYVLLGGGA